MLVNQGSSQVSEDRNDWKVVRGGKVYREVAGNWQKRGEGQAGDKTKTSEHIFCLLCCSAFDLSAWKNKRERAKKYRWPNALQGCSGQKSKSLQDLLDHSYSARNVLIITASIAMWWFLFLIIFHTKWQCQNQYVLDSGFIKSPLEVFLGNRSCQDQHLGSILQLRYFPYFATLFFFFPSGLENDKMSLFPYLFEYYL